ncbi:MAG TPA: hypothetical protein VJ302_35265 [Blastocatellia bacterium]|nr:hypothetical protein [Blastocatellia bacterium]
MNEDLGHQELMTRYLLGSLSEAEQDRVEETFFTDPDFFNELMARRDDLIDSFARGELAAPENELFERRVRSSPALCQKVEFARALIVKLEAAASPRLEPVAIGMEPGSSTWPLSGFGSRWPVRPVGGWRWSLLAASLLISAGGLWLTIRRGDAPRPPVVDQVAIAPSPAAAPSDSRAAAAPEKSPAPSSLPAAAPPPRRPARWAASIAGFLLAAGASRADDGLRELELPARTITVRLQLEIDPDAPRHYRAVLRTPGGSPLWARDQVSAVRQGRSRVVVCDVPAALLEERNYILRLHPQSAEDSADIDYYFRITKP